MRSRKKPYENVSDKLVIDSLNIDDAKYWDDPQVSDIKQRIRQYLLTEFNDKCAYCKETLKPEIFHIAIEHILPKSKYPHHTLTFENLAIACDRCNTLKGNKDTLVTYVKNLKRYPDTSEFKIVHPFLDKYEDYINDNDGLYYSSDEPKGRETIKMMKLYESNFIEKKLVRRRTEAMELGKRLSDTHYTEEEQAFKKEVRKSLASSSLDDLEKEKLYLEIMEAYKKRNFENVVAREVVRLEELKRGFFQSVNKDELDAIFEFLYKKDKDYILHEHDLHVFQVVARYFDDVSKDGLDNVSSPFATQAEKDAAVSIYTYVKSLNWKSAGRDKLLYFKVEPEVKANYFYEAFNLELVETIKVCLEAYRGMGVRDRKAIVR